jgi:hypothetical protein
VLPDHLERPSCYHPRHVLTRHGIQDKDTPRSIRVDQGGEFARSKDFRKIVSQHGYVVEPTGSDTPSQHGRVERLNQTFGVMVRSLLYSSGLTPRFWSDALIHAVYLKNRLWHGAIQRTPYEAYFSEKPGLSHLRVFGSLVTSRISGDRPAKLDRHTFHGIFLGDTATDLNVRYYDLNSGRIKTARHAVFDEAHYMSAKRPPGPKFLFDLGLEDSSDPAPPPTVTPALSPPAPLPPTAPCSPVPVPISALTTMLLYREHAAPMTAADAMLQPVLTGFPDRDAIASLEFSCDPFGPSFDEPVSLSGLHPTAGLDLVDDNARGHPYLRACLPSTPAEKLLRWRSRIRHAFLIAIDGVPVHTIDVVQQAITAIRPTPRHQGPLYVHT